MASLGVSDGTLRGAPADSPSVMVPPRTWSCVTRSMSSWARPGVDPIPSVPIAPDNSGPGLRPTAGSWRSRPLVVRDQGSGRTPPPPPSGRDPRPPKPSKIRPPKGRIFPDFWGLRCSAQGGWGGSAHYPDPTAQSVLRAESPSRRLARHAGTAFRACLAAFVRRKSKKFLFFFGRLFCLRGGRERVWQSPAVMWPSAAGGAAASPNG